MNGTHQSSCFSHTVGKVGKTFALILRLYICFADRKHLIGIVVYKTKTMRKTINFFIVNMAASDLLFPIFLFPLMLTELYADSQISGSLGQVLCKVLSFLKAISLSVSIQSLVLIAVDRFGAVVFPLRTPFISSKLRPFFTLATTWIIPSAVQITYFFFLKPDQHAGEIECAVDWNEVFGESSSVENYVLAVFVVFLFITFWCW